MQRATVVVQPSRKEGWGLTVLEANACGTPVVATDVPGLRDSVRHGTSGLLAAANPESLATCLLSVLSDDELRARLARGARAWSERFRWDHVADAFADVVRAVASGAPLPDVPDFIGGTMAAEQGAGCVPGALPGSVEVGG